MKRSVFAMSVLATLAGCSDLTDPVQPLLPPAPPSNPAIVSAGWRFNVLGSEGEVIVEPPSSGYDESQQLLGDFFGVQAGSPALSILAGDVVDVAARNLTFTAPNVPVIGQRQATFEVQIINQLSGANLIAPTFPPPPAGTTGTILFPFQIELININRDSVAGQQGDGTFVIVTTPNQGLVAPSTAWDGPLTNFFNDNAPCTTNGNNTPGSNSTDCYRYEEFDDVILALGSSAWQPIGFDLDLSVTDFQVRAIVAADLQNSAVNVAPTGDFELASYSGAVPASVVTRVVASDGVAPGGVSSINFDLDGNGTFEFVGTLGGPSTARFADASFLCTAARAAASPVTIQAEITDNQSSSIVVDALLNCALPAPNATIDVVAPASATAGTGYNVVINVQNVSFTPLTITNIAYNAAPQGAINFVLAACTNALCTDGGTATRTVPVTAGATGTTTTHTGTVTFGAETRTDVATTSNTSAPNLSFTWYNASGAPITTANVGQVVTLQMCTVGAQAGAVATFSGDLAGFGAVAAPVVVGNAAELNSVTTGIGPCANVGGVDQINQPTVFVPAAQAGGQINLVNVTLAGAPTTGPQGLFNLSLTLDAAGTLNAAFVSPPELGNFTFGTIPPVFTIPTLVVNP